MEIKVNKEVRDYTENIFLGLSFRQFLLSVIACVVAIIIYLSTVDILGMEITSWLCMIGAAPFASLVFISFQKMNAEEILVTAFQSLLLSSRNLIDQPFNLYHEMFKEIFNRKIKEALNKNDKKLYKIKKIKQREI